MYLTIIYFDTYKKNINISDTLKRIRSKENTLILLDPKTGIKRFMLDIINSRSINKLTKMEVFTLSYFIKNNEDAKEYLKNNRILSQQLEDAVKRLRKVVKIGGNKEDFNNTYIDRISRFFAIAIGWYEKKIQQKRTDKDFDQMVDVF